MLRPSRMFATLCLLCVAATLVRQSSAAAASTTWYGMFMNGRKIGFLTATQDTVNENGRERKRLTTRSSVTLTMMGTTLTQETDLITVMDASLRPLRQQYTIVSGGSTTRIQATFAPKEVRCVVEAGGSPSTRVIPIPPGAVIAADTGLPGVSETLRVGTRSTVYSLNPLTVSLDKTTVFVEARVRAELAGVQYDAFRVVTTTPLGKATGLQTSDGELLWATLPLQMAVYRMSEQDAAKTDAPVPAHAEMGETPASGASEPDREEDFAALTAIVPDKPIPSPRTTRRLVLDLGGLPSDVKPLADARQAVASLGRKQVNGHSLTYRYTISAAKPPTRGVKLPVKSGSLSRYVRSGPYLDLDRVEVRTLARRLRDPGGDTAQTASRIRAWIHGNMTADYGIGTPRSACDILSRRRGVCRDYATLFTAIARAAGVPTKAVGGIVYADGRFYYHAWAECWVGAWIPFDATLPSDFVDATHVKFSEGEPTDMMQVFRIIGKLTVKVVAHSE